MTSSKTLFIFSLAFISGIFANSFFLIPNSIIFLFLFLTILSFLFSFWFKNFIIFGFCLIFFLFGIWRYQLAIFQIENSSLRKFNNIPEEISLVGTIMREPQFGEKSQELIIKVEQIYHDGTISKFNEKILIITRRYPEYKYGQKLKLFGKISTPAEYIEGFNYKGFLEKEGIYSIMNFPKIELLEEKANLPLVFKFYGKILKLKEKLRKSISENLPSSESVLLRAMLLGDKKQISDKLGEKLNITGLRHITAISGMHVTILSSILLNVFLGLGFWRKQALIFSLFFIFLFILMTGLQPSAIRAGIMGGIFILAQYFGKAYASSRAISFAAFLMLLQNPLLLKYDIGFQLSFLAMTGIIFFSPILESFFRKIPNLFQLKNILVLTFSAQVFTLPLLLFNFGYFSLIAPITNILVLPILPLILGLGFLFAFLGLFFRQLGHIFSLPCWILLTYLLKVVNFFSRSWAAKIFNISWQWLIISYLFLGLITWRLNEKQKLKFLSY